MTPVQEINYLMNLLNVDMSGEIESLIDKYGIPAVEPDHELCRPMLVAFYRKNKQKVSRRKSVNHAQKHVNNFSIYACLADSIGNLESFRRTAKHQGYPVMAFVFELKQEYHYLTEANRIVYFKAQTWAHLARHLNEDEVWFLEGLEAQYPSHFQGQLSLTI